MSDQADRELLELAAKAAGVGPLDFDYSERDGFGAAMYWGPRLPLPQGVLMAAMYTYWNPLDDDGDALRLAVKLNLRVQVCYEDFMHDREFVEVRWDTADGMEFHLLEHDPDPYTATRRAIVRAAAEMGKAMK